jgi:hypothetical protein
MTDGQSECIVVLSDGETWSTIGEVSLCVISRSELDKLESGEVRVRDLKPRLELTVREFWQ